mgnify:FL=1
MFSSNMFVTFSESNILQTVVIAVMLGVAIMLVKKTSTVKSSSLARTPCAAWSSPSSA